MTNIYIDPLIADNSTADKELNKLIIPSEEAEEQFKGLKINELLRPLPDFTPIPII